MSATRTRGFVKVQDGCDCHCSYCIIPKVRGGARSRPASAVLDEVRRRVAQGQPEMVMTGISVGDYRDPERGLELGDLMREVAAVPGVERVRLSSVEVIHVRDSLLDALAEEPRICPHLHVPLQSGDDGVLAAMGRNYDAAGYCGAIERLRARVPHVNVTTDVIVGYPTEDEAAFERTLDARARDRHHEGAHVQLLRAARAPRPTGSATPCRPRRRSAAAASCAACPRCSAAATARRKLGATEEVLVDKVADAQVSGYSRDYTRCYLPAGAARRGRPSPPARRSCTRTVSPASSSSSAVVAAPRRGRAGGGPAGCGGAGRGTSRRDFGDDCGASAARSVKKTGVEPITHAPRKVTHTELYTPSTISAMPTPTQMVIRRTLRWPARSRAVTLT